MAITDFSRKIAFPALGLGQVAVPTDLVRTLKRCLNKDASRRPTVDQLIAERDLCLYPNASDKIFVSEQILGQLVHGIVNCVKTNGVPPPEESESWSEGIFRGLQAAVEVDSAHAVCLRPK